MPVEPVLPEMPELKKGMHLLRINLHKTTMWYPDSSTYVAHGIARIVGGKKVEFWYDNIHQVVLKVKKGEPTPMAHIMDSTVKKLEKEVISRGEPRLGKKAEKVKEE